MINLQHLKKCSSLKSPVLNFEEQELYFSTDTRRYRHPGAFVAIPGAKVNPLDLLPPLLEQGCSLVIYQDDEVNRGKVENLQRDYPEVHFLAVTNSVTFLQELTHHHMVEWKSLSTRNTVFAISGSNGKTTHKEMLFHILKETFPGKIVCTEKNNNNHLGVPLTLLDVSRNTEFLVLELGSNHPGEIKVLCDIAVPNAGITTNIGATHLEFFGSEEAVFQEEAYLYYAVKNFTKGKGRFLINMDDPYLETLPNTAGSITYGTAAKAEARISFLDQGAEITYQGKKLRALNPAITGQHNKLNLITCLFIATLFYPESQEQLTKAAGTFRPTKNRSQWIEFEGVSVFLDAYNANPSSMKAALHGFKEEILKKGLELEDTCVVLGDMNELGDATSLYHQDVGRFVKQLGFPHVFFVGRFAHYYKLGFEQGHIRSSSAEFKHEYRSECLKRYRIHFIKGSRSLQLESLFDIT